MAGFADLRSLYFSLALQLEGWFAALPEIMGTGWGWEEFEKESWAFKHDRLTIERRIDAGGTVKTSDISHLLELFQSALLKYWEVILVPLDRGTKYWLARSERSVLTEVGGCRGSQFEPMTEAQRKAAKEKEAAEEKDEPAEALRKKQNKTGSAPHLATFQPRQSISNDVTEASMRQALVAPAIDGDGKVVEESLIKSRTVKVEESDHAGKREGGEDAEPVPPPKRVSLRMVGGFPQREWRRRSEGEG